MNVQKTDLTFLLAITLIWTLLLLGASAQTDEATASSTASNTESNTVLSTAAELFPYLQAGTYQSFSAESAPHASVGAHGLVRTFVNPILEEALAAGSATHPAGSAAVKELYDGGELAGWAVYVKTQEDSAGGSGFYWYEVSSTTDPTQVVADGNGVQPCVGCHAAGTDFTRSAYPLQ